jgi:hypothetical protein
LPQQSGHTGSMLPRRASVNDARRRVLVIRVRRAILAAWHQTRSGESPRVRVSKPKLSARERPRLWRAAAHC